MTVGICVTLGEQSLFPFASSEADITSTSVGLTTLWLRRDDEVLLFLGLLAVEEEVAAEQELFEALGLLFELEDVRRTKKITVMS